MKIRRVGVLLVCLALSFSFVHTTAAAYDESDPLTEQYVADPFTKQYAAELSGYTSLAYYKGENAARYIAFKMRFTDCSWETIITDVNIGLDTAYFTNVAEIRNPGSVDVLVNKYNALPKDFVPDDLEKINAAYCFKTEMLTHDARVAFETMCADARALGYALYATSSYRSYDRQRELYNSYGIPDVTTARPGHSEHQTGLAVDVIHDAVASNSGLTNSAVYEWYAENACNYGFVIRYAEGWQFLTGVAFEPWHLRYLGVELATAVKTSYLSYDEYYTRYIGLPEVNESEGGAVGVTAVSCVTAGATFYSLSSFRVLGDTYFKLRDIAVILSGTDFGFDVLWDDDAKQISLLTGAAYSSALTLSDFKPGQVLHMTATMPPMEIGQIPYELSAFMVDGSNYYTLETLGELLGFAVTEDEAGGLFIAPAVLGDEPAIAASPAA